MTYGILHCVCSWLESLTEMISNISGKFSKFFQDMNCVGEVDLLQDDTVSTIKLDTLYL